MAHIDDSVFKRLESGFVKLGKPVDFLGLVPRDELVSKIRSVIEGSGYSKQFGIVLGPTGTGKTLLTKQACVTPSSKGIIYLEISNVETLVGKLAQAVALKTSPTIFDNMIEYILKGYKSHHTIPDNDVDGLLYVISQVEKSAKKYEKKYNKMPSLIILMGVTFWLNGSRNHLQSWWYTKNSVCEQ